MGCENIWIGIDDTDSRQGGCTTHLALKLIEKLKKEKIDIIGYPRLVRLNPNIPWKTRGNGAISIQIAKGCGKKEIIGRSSNELLYCYQEINKDNVNEEKIQKILDELIIKNAKLQDTNTNSGFVITKQKPSINLYKDTLYNIRTIRQTKEFLNSFNSIYKGYKNSRGLIGATASIAWDNSSDKTYEIITYRPKESWGRKRKHDDKATIKIDKEINTTFDNFDYTNKHNRLYPNSPCPVLYGIRGDDVKDLIKAKELINSKELVSWLIFETNQGTDDHLQKSRIDKIKPYQSVITNGEVISEPVNIKGGHVIFKIKDSSGTIDCAAYEPTKEFRKIIRNLIIGDKIEVYGGVRKRPLSINLEKIRIIKLKKAIEKIENPICPKCNKHMKSKGKNQGYKCIRCGLKSNKAIYKKRKRKIKEMTYEVPVCARRHLSKPLKRFK